jgi:hypothetical protein
MSKAARRTRRTPRQARASASSRKTLPAVRRGEATPGASAQQRLARLLDSPHLARMMPHLAPETLHELIRREGLDACGELLTLATPDQLTALVDLDLWRQDRPGRDEGFDEERFGEWLEVLVETGDATAARTIAALDHHLVVTGLSRYVRVFDAAVFVRPDTDDEWLAEPAFGGPVREIGGYVVRAKRTDAWDAIVALLLELDACHRHYFDAVMQGCRRLSNSTPEVDGLDDLLMAPEQLLHDVGSDREQRRSQRGYATPAEARAFLQMARQPADRRQEASSSGNPLAAAYFRAAEEGARAAQESGRRHAPAPAQLRRAGAAASMEEVAALLAEAGLLPAHPRALLEGTAPQPAGLARIRPLMERVRDSDEGAYAERSQELAFLANTLVAGCSVQSRPFTTQEAADAALSVCNLGLEYWPQRWPARSRDAAPIAAGTAAMPATFLIDCDLVTAFEVGWAVLHEEVSLFVAGHLIEMLTDLRSVDEVIQDGLETLRRALFKARDRGMPWQARGALDVIAMLDTPAWASLMGLLDECPVLPAALTATLERRTGPISATAFEFISTTDQLRQVRAFTATLLDVLLR